MQKPILRFFTVILTLLAVLSSPSAFAAGQFKVKSTQINETSGAWRVIVSLIQLPKPPALRRVPMRFIFTQKIIYERSLVDGKSEPVTSRISVPNGAAKQETLDVDFSDTSGKIYNQTRYDFGITRESGYVAGEYEVRLRTLDGAEVGKPVLLQLHGDNEVTDRRTMAFSTKDPKIKKHDDGVEKPKAATADENEANYQGDVAPIGDGEPFVSDEGKEETEEENIKVRKGTCGCEVVGVSTPLDLGALSALGLLGTVLVARRRSRRAPDTANRSET